MHSQPKTKGNVRLRVERKETTLEVVRGKGGGRELVAGGKGKICKTRPKKVRLLGKTFSIASLATTTLNRT